MGFKTSLRSILTTFQEFKKGEKLHDRFTAEWANDVMRSIYLLAKGRNIISGQGVKKTEGACEVILASSASRPTTTPSDQCQLYPYATTDAGGNNKIAVTWGTIAGRQPTGFHAGGFPVFKISPQGSSGFIYAKATVNFYSLQWTAAEVIVSSSMKANTNQMAYVLMGSYKIENKSLTVTGICGPATPVYCDLAP